MNLALVCLGLNMTIMLYVTLIMPLKGMEADIEKVPKLVPIMTAASLLLPLFLTLAIWPIWGFLSPIYMFILCFIVMFNIKKGSVTVYRSSWASLIFPLGEITEPF